jgi:hypothetical protein
LAASDGAFTDRVELSWEPSDNATGYKVYRALAGNGITWYAEIGTSVDPYYDDTAAEQGEIYSYKVRAFNTFFNSNYSDPDTGFAAVEIILPDAPSGVSASDGSYADRIRLTWNAAGNALYYKIYRAALGGSTTLYVEIDDTPNTSYDDYDIQGLLTYVYKIKAFNNFGASDFSLSDTGFLNDCPGDFDLDGDVDGSDLAAFAVDFGRTNCGQPPMCEGDFDRDQDVDGSDLATFATDFGRTNCMP